MFKQPQTPSLQATSASTSSTVKKPAAVTTTVLQVTLKTQINHDLSRF